MTQAEWLAEFAAVLRATAQQGVREPAGRDPLSARSPVVGNGHFGYRVCRGTSGGPAGRSRRIEPVPPATRPLTRQPSIRYIGCW
jgi:hypothetical protein